MKSPSPSLPWIKKIKKKINISKKKRMITTVYWAKKLNKLKIYITQIKEIKKYDKYIINS